MAGRGCRQLVPLVAYAERVPTLSRKVGPTMRTLRMRTTVTAGWGPATKCRRA